MGDRAQCVVDGHPAAYVDCESCFARQWRHTEAGGPHHGADGHLLPVGQDEAARVDPGDRRVLLDAHAEAAKGPVQVAPSALRQSRPDFGAGEQPHAEPGVGFGQLGSRLDAGQAATDYGQ
jgi:hypothetical protein